MSESSTSLAGESGSDTADAEASVLVNDIHELPSQSLDANMAIDQFARFQRGCDVTAGKDVRTWLTPRHMKDRTTNHEYPRFRPLTSQVYGRS